MRKIVILDGSLVNPGDLSWDALASLGELEIFDRTTKEMTLERCKNAEIVITNKVLMKREEISNLPSLKYIGVAATGYNNVDVEAAREHNVLVANVPAYSTPSTAQHTFALLLEATNHVGLHNEAIQKGEWVHSRDFSFWKKQIIELQSLKLGIIGFGTIGQKVAEIANAFGMKILVHSRSALKKVNFEVQEVDQDTLFKESDIISLHCPLNKETEHLINITTLGLMKKTAILINTSRGGLVDEQALSTALKEKRILGAAVDVLELEPPTPYCPLLNLDNCIITPHISWASQASRGRLLNEIIENVKAYLSGNPKNIVTPK